MSGVEAEGKGNASSSGDKEKLPLELHGKRWYLKVKRGSKDMASSKEHQNSQTGSTGGKRSEN